MIFRGKIGKSGKIGQNSKISRFIFSFLDLMNFRKVSIFSNFGPFSIELKSFIPLMFKKLKNRSQT